MDILSKLGFDLSSVVLYIVNMGLLIAILSYLLFPKIIHFLDERRKLIGDSISEANQLKELFQKKIEEMNAEKEAMQKEMKMELDNVRSFAEKRRTELAKEMEEERARMFKEAQDEIETRKNQLVKEVEQKLTEAMRKIIIQVIQNKVPEDVIKESVEESWSKYSRI